MSELVVFMLTIDSTLVTPSSVCNILQEWLHTKYPNETAFHLIKICISLIMVTTGAKSQILSNPIL